MKKLLFLLPVIFLTSGMAYAEPFENLETSILEISDNTATLKITWDADESASHYKIGCVSCFPHITTSTTENIVIFGNVTSFPSNSMAMLYGIAYDLEDEIISAKQILVKLVQ